MIVKDLSELDTSRDYDAVVFGHADWGAWVLSFNGRYWEAHGDRGVVHAGVHYWEVSE